MASPVSPAASPSEHTQVFHARHEQIRQLQRDLHSALQGHAKRGRLRDDEHDDDDPLAGVHLTKRELEVHNRLLNDEVLLLRFLKKHKFDLVATRTAFLHHVRFRISSGLDTLTLNNFLSSAKCPENLFRFLPQTDSFGRPVGLLSLKEAAGLSQDDLLKFFAVVFDVGRRWLKEINEARWINEVDCGDDMDEEPAEGGSDAPVKPVVITTAPDSPVAVDEPESRQLNVNGTHFKPPLPKGTLDSDSQTTVVDDHDLLSPPRSRKRTGSNSSTSTALSLSISIPTPRRVLSDDDILRRTIVPQLSLIVDLDGVGVSNFNASLPQPLMHLMSAHFPSMLAQTYILNFRWVHQGMWGIVKNILPSGATNRITFANGVDELAGLLGIPKESISDAPLASRCRVFRRLLRPSSQLPRSTWESYVGDLSGSLDEGYHERSASDTDSASAHGEPDEEDDDPFFDARSEISDISTHLSSSKASLSRSVTLSASAAAVAYNAALPSHLANSRVVQFIRQVLSLPLRAFDNVLVALAKQTFTSIARRVATAVVCFVAVLLVGSNNKRGEWLQKMLMSSIVGPVLGLTPASVSGARRFLPWETFNV